MTSSKAARMTYGLTPRIIDFMLTCFIALGQSVLPVSWHLRKLPQHILQSIGCFLINSSSATVAKVAQGPGPVTPTKQDPLDNSLTQEMCDVFSYIVSVF